MAQQFDIVGNLLLKVDGAESGLNKLKNSLNQLKIPAKFDTDLKKSFSNLDGLFAKYKSQLEGGFKTKGDISGFAKTGKQIEAEYDRIVATIGKLTGKEVRLKIDLTGIQNAEKEIEQLIVKKEKLTEDIKGGLGLTNYLEAMRSSGVGRRGTKVFDASNMLQTSLEKGDIESAKANVQNLITELNRMSEARKQALEAKTGVSFNQVIETLKTKVESADQSMTKLGNDIKTTSDNMAQMQTNQLDRADQVLSQIATDAGAAQTGIKGLNGEAQGAAQNIQSMATQLEQLQTSTQYFFSLRNMINLLKRGLREAISTIKELDAAMTKTAVVTKFDVSDMWAKLPEYTANANALGASVKDMYEATTLYYQQGLNDQQAMGIATETMKMARIGGLEAADATDKMTAALRGFNMELNETSAQRVNDVYSNLAAKTASDTNELGTAMQRTASIAASAGMSFEGTAAFLAQAIETTREPAENLGTAMKTIVARFTELKKNPLEITEVDGEEVSYNKVDTALQSIGVSLKDANGQFRDLDQVFLDISQRWDSLTQTQQRYIATTAAGSRQQSRFIAMMSNYERTTQLMEYANDANGASAEQFGKTLESLEAKIYKFQNAWKTFLMGIMNDSWTKGIVDGTTQVLTLVTKLIDVLSFGGRAKGIKSFLSLFMAFQGLKYTGRGVNALIGGLAGSLDPTVGFRKGMSTGMLGKQKNEINQATNRIVNAINGLVPYIKGDNVANNQYRFQDPGRYNQARRELIDNLGGRFGQVKGGQGTYTVGSLLGTINSHELNKQQQKQFFQASPGLKKNLTKSLVKLYEDVGTDKKTTQALVKGFKSGDLALEEALLNNPKLSGTVEEVAKEIGQKSGRAAGWGFRDVYYKEAYNEGIERGLNEEQANKYANETLKNKRVLNTKGQEFLQNPQVLTTSQKFANLAGQIGAGFMAAGSAVQMFGAQVSQVNPILGQAISNLGGLLTAVGSLANVIPAVLAGGPVAWGIAAAVTVVGGLAVGLKVHAENLKKSGEEIVQTYTETSDELQSSIDNMKSYESELKRLSAGVDKNGFNINLDDSEFQRYKELVEDLVKQNPNVVKGWNSEGRAIVDVNSALKETIKLKQQDLQIAKNTYLSNESGRKLIEARNVTKGYKKATTSNSNLVFDANQVVDTIVHNGLDEEARAAGFDLDKIRQGDLQAIAFLRDHYDILENIYKQGGQEISEGLSSQIGKLTDNLEAYEEAIAPVVDYLTEYANTEKLFADLPVELTEAFNEGLKSIAGKDLSVGEMKKAAQYLSLELRDAFTKAKGPLEDAEKALDQYAQDLDETAYNNSAEKAAAKLRILRDEAEAVGQVEIAEWYENQASRIEKALTETTLSISDYVDTLADNIANAKNNFDALAEGVDDYYTLADQAGGLVETALSDKNIDGKGSKTFWNTYRGLASEDAYNEHDRDKAVANMKLFQKYFTEGAEGSAAFAEKIIELQKKEFTFTDKYGEATTAQLSDFFKVAADGTISVTEAFSNLTDEQYAQIASVFDLSADGFTAILNKLRQFGDLNFADVKGIRKALPFDDRVIKTEQDVTVEGEKNPFKRLYYGQSMMESELADQDEDTKTDIVNKLEVTGAIQLPTGAKNLIKAGTGETKDGSLLKQFVEDTKGTGNQVENVMKALYQSGEYDKEDLELIHSELIKNDELLKGVEGSDQGFDELFTHIEKSLDNSAVTESNDHLTHISSAVDTIANIIAAGKVEEGYLPEVARQSDELYNEIVGEKGVADTWMQLFSQGKDASGNRITDIDTYKALEEKLKGYQDYNNKYIEDLKAGRAAAEARGASPEELKAFDDEIAKAEHNAELIKQYLNDAADYIKVAGQSMYSAQNITGPAKTVIEDTSTENFNKEGINDITSTITTAFKGLLETPNILTEDKISSATELLQTTANKLLEANWDPSQIQSFFKDNFDIELELNENGEFASNIGDQIQDQLNNMGDTEINAVLNIKEFTLPGGLASGQNNPNSVFHRHGTMARGSRKGYTIAGRPTLTGEEGEELVWEPKRNEVYMVGSNGPQFANISKDAVVWNANQTKRIKKNSKMNSIGTGARGIHSFGTMDRGNAANGTKIPGMLDINAMANIQEVTPPEEEPTIPVKADLQVEGNKGGGLLSKLFGGNKGGPSIDVAANVTTLRSGKQLQAMNIVGNITQLKSETSANSIDATAIVTRVTRGNQIIGEPITVKATATTTVVKNENKTPEVSTGNQVIKVTANTSAAQSRINKLISIFNKTYTLKYQAVGPRSISVPISANFTGPWKKTVEINKSGARGINNAIKNYSTPLFGSAAKGRYGTIGPKNRGGLTLTGEKGFEIAWIPSENRSMVLGTNGPQMLKLPRDAVVYSHEQSKKILSQKAIPAGSHYGDNNSVAGNDITKYLKFNNSNNNSNNNNNNNNNIKSAAESVKKASKTITNTTLKTASKVGKVSVWWENIARTTEGVQRKADKAYAKFEEYIKKMQATLKTTGTTGKGNAYIANMTKVIGKNEAQRRKANKELKRLNNSNKKTTVKYKNSKGKEASKKIKLSNFIKYDAESGSYVIDQKKISKIAKSKKRGGKNAAEAIKSKAEEKLNDKLSKRNKAEDEIRKAEEAIDKFGQELYDTFFGWKSELTEILDITKKIEEAQKRISRSDAYEDLLEAQVGSGQRSGEDAASATINNFVNRLKEQDAILEERKKAITQSQEDLRKAYTATDEKKALAEVKNKLAQDAKYDKAKAKFDSAATAKKKVTKAQNDKKKKLEEKKELNEEIKKLKNKDKLSTKQQKKLSKLIKRRSQVDADIKADNKIIRDNKAEANKYDSAKSRLNKIGSGANLNATEKLAYEEYQRQLEQDIKVISTAQKYMGVTQRADGTISIDFNQTAFEEDKSKGNITEEMAKAIQEYVEEIREDSESLIDAQQSLIEDVTEYYKTLRQLREEWADYAKQLVDISEAAEKEQIDRIKKLSDSLKKAFDRLIKDVKNKLDERRKQEDNAQKERDISQKQQRLAMLRADTSGGHQVEIAQLEKEIADAQQDYQRSLEDQLIERLQQQADLAAEQRERQIQIQEAIAESVNNIELVNEWMSNPEKYLDVIKEAYLKSKNYDQLSDPERALVIDDWENFKRGLLTNQIKQSELFKKITLLEDELELISELIEKGNLTLGNTKGILSVSQAHDSFTGVSYKDLVTKGKYTLQDFLDDPNIKYSDIAAAGFAPEQVIDAEKETNTNRFTQEAQNAINQRETDKQARITAEQKAAENAREIAEKQRKQDELADAEAAYAQYKAAHDAGKKNLNWVEGNTDASRFFTKLIDASSNGSLGPNELIKLIELGSKVGYSIKKVVKYLVNTKELNWEDVLKAAKKSGKFSKNDVKNWGSSAAFTKALSKWSKFATGGLADYTGPAWLDGTPSKPELVLNATDTKNFIALKDVLSRAVNSISSADGASYGDIIYDININVDKIEKDYDVDRVVDKVKKEIVKSSGYRNVTQVRNLR